MFRPINILDLFGVAGIVIAALTESPLWWLVAIVAFGLLSLSAWGSHLPDEHTDGGSGNV